MKRNPALVERLFNQASRLSVDEQLLLAIRLIKQARRELPRRMTAGDLLNSNLVGMWARRQDIGDNIAFARALRAQAQKRERSA